MKQYISEVTLVYLQKRTIVIDHSDYVVEKLHSELFELFDKWLR